MNEIDSKQYAEALFKLRFGFSKPDAEKLYWKLFAEDNWTMKWEEECYNLSCPECERYILDVSMPLALMEPLKSLEAVKKEGQRRLHEHLVTCKCKGREIRKPYQKAGLPFTQ